MLASGLAQDVEQACRQANLMLRKNKFHNEQVVKARVKRTV